MSNNAELRNVRIPVTNIQTPLTTSIKFIVPVNSSTIASTVDLYGTQKSGALFRTVGVAKGITVFSKDEKREIEKLYGFNGDEMEPFVIAPGQQDVTITLNRIVFYADDFFEQLGFIRGNLLYQENPFIIVEEHQKIMSSRKPLQSELGNMKTWWYDDKSLIVETTYARSFLYFDCWIASNPIKYDITSDNLILIPEFKILTGKIVSTEDVGRTLGSDIANVFGSFVRSQNSVVKQKI